MREFATGSTTSSRVMELMSNQASEMFQGIQTCNPTAITVVVAHVVSSTESNVQSFVQVSDDEFVVLKTHAEVHLAS